MFFFRLFGFCSLTFRRVRFVFFSNCYFKTFPESHIQINPPFCSCTATNLPSPLLCPTQKPALSILFPTLCRVLSLDFIRWQIWQVGQMPWLHSIQKHVIIHRHGIPIGIINWRNRRADSSSLTSPPRDFEFELNLLVYRFLAPAPPTSSWSWDR